MTKQRSHYETTETDSPYMVCGSVAAVVGALTGYNTAFPTAIACVFFAYLPKNYGYVLPFIEQENTIVIPKTAQPVLNESNSSDQDLSSELHTAYIEPSSGTYDHI